MNCYVCPCKAEYTIYVDRKPVCERHYEEAAREEGPALVSEELGWLSDDQAAELRNQMRTHREIKQPA